MNRHTSISSFSESPEDVTLDKASDTTTQEVKMCDVCVNKPCSSNQLYCVQYDPSVKSSDNLDPGNDPNRVDDAQADKHVNIENTATTTAPEQTEIKLGTLNVCGLKHRLNIPEFVSLLNSYDIFCVCETKLDSFDKISIPNYTFFSKPRSEPYKRKSGGLGVFVHNSLAASIDILDSDTDYIFWLKCTYYHQSLIVGCMYVPPEQSRFYNDDENLRMISP